MSCRTRLSDSWMGHASQGRFQLIACFLLGCIQLPVTFTDNLLHLYAATPLHRCKVRLTDSLQPNRTVVGESELRPLVDDHGQKVYSSCQMYLDPRDHSLGTQSCIFGWEYLYSEEEWTLVSEWNLVCERNYLIHLLPYVYCAGAMLGSLLFGIAGDHCGRKNYLLLALFAHTVLGVSLHFMPNFTYFATVYTFQGIFVTGIQCLSVVLLLETIFFTHHLKAIILVAAFWPTGTLLLSILAWLIRNWRYVQVAVTSPGIVCIGYFWLLPRSLPWLLTEGLLNEVQDQLQKFARFNKTVLPHNFRLHLQNVAKAIRACLGPSGSSHSLESMVCAPKLRRFTFILYYLWFIVFCESNVSSADVPALTNNKYAFLFVKGLMDLGMNILVYFLALRFGPRFLQAALLIVGGFLCMASAFVDIYIPNEAIHKRTSLLILITPICASVGKAAVRAVVPTLFFFSVKVFPTGVRALGVGSCLFWSRSALMIGHHVSSLDLDAKDYLPLALWGALCFIGGCLTFLLPSNTCRPLPNVALELVHDVVIDGGLRKPRITLFQRPTFPARQDEQSMSPFELPEGDAPRCSTPEASTLRMASGIGDCNCQLDPVPGTSGLGSRREFRSRIKEDNESRLTDFEEELAKVWDLNANQRDDRSLSTDSSLREFHRGDMSSHFRSMNETSF